MGLLELIMFIAFMGLIVWGITTLVPMPAPFKNAIIVIAVIAMVIIVLKAFGLFHGIPNIEITK